MTLITPSRYVANWEFAEYLGVWHAFARLRASFSLRIGVIVMGKRKLAPDADVIDSTGPEWHGTNSDPAGASGPSLGQQKQARTSPSKAKRLRKNPQSSDASLPEKRDATFKKSCPKNILDRVARVMSQRFFMIDRRREGNELKEEFKVLGSTGNVYTVTIGKLPSCDYASRGNHCKHILFIYLKVLQVPQSSDLWYQKALLTGELESIFTNAPLAPGVLAHDGVRNAYASATGKNQTATSSSTKRRVPGPEDDCSICYESMHGESEGRLTFCEECGNALHSECFEQWRRSAAELTCVWCRAKWNQGDINESSAGPSSEGYINLGGLLASVASATEAVIITVGGGQVVPDLEA
ncbi:hypothetical protein H4582DRAFT_883725 [Lactarius indigo]|nr:hypothetical protein H4582DRAFT_883725 [Lactarius indigo]